MCIPADRQHSAQLGQHNEGMCNQECVMCIPAYRQHSAQLGQQNEGNYTTYNIILYSFNI